VSVARGRTFVLENIKTRPLFYDVLQTDRPLGKHNPVAEAYVPAETDGGWKHEFTKRQGKKIKKLKRFL